MSHIGFGTLNICTNSVCLYHGFFFKDCWTSCATESFTKMMTDSHWTKGAEKVIVIAETLTPSSSSSLHTPTVTQWARTCVLNAPISGTSCPGPATVTEFVSKQEPTSSFVEPSVTQITGGSDRDQRQATSSLSSLCSYSREWYSDGSFSVSYSTFGLVTTHHALSQTAKGPLDAHCVTKVGIYSVIADSTKRSCVSGCCDETTTYSNETFDAKDSKIARFATTRQYVVHHTSSNGQHSYMNGLVVEQSTSTKTSFVTVTANRCSAKPTSPRESLVKVKIDWSIPSLRVFVLGLTSFFYFWFLNIMAASVCYQAVRTATLIKAGQKVFAESISGGLEHEVAAIMAFAILLTLDNPLSTEQGYLETSPDVSPRALERSFHVFVWLPKTGIKYAVVVYFTISTNWFHRRMNEIAEERKQRQGTQDSKDVPGTESIDMLEKLERQHNPSSDSMSVADSKQVAPGGDNAAHKTNQSNMANTEAWEIVGESEAGTENGELTP